MRRDARRSAPDRKRLLGSHFLFRFVRFALSLPLFPPREKAAERSHQSSHCAPARAAGKRIFEPGDRVLPERLLNGDGKLLNVDGNRISFIRKDRIDSATGIRIDERDTNFELLTLAGVGWSHVPHP